MTIAAREVLEDCRGALAELTDGLQGRQWRRRWIVAVVLLRAVGHVLEKVDSLRSPAYQAAISTWWARLKATKPHPEIFWGFIDQERNSILKEYKTSAGQGATIQLSGIGWHLTTGEDEVDPPNPPFYHYTINTGTFQGRDQQDLIREAIDWWATQLDAIDAAAQSRP